MFAEHRQPDHSPSNDRAVSASVHDRVRSRTLAYHKPLHLFRPVGTHPNLVDAGLKVFQRHV